MMNVLEEIAEEAKDEDGEDDEGGIEDLTTIGLISGLSAIGFVLLMTTVAAATLWRRNANVTAASSMSSVQAKPLLPDDALYVYPRAGEYGKRAV